VTIAAAAIEVVVAAAEYLAAPPLARAAASAAERARDGPIRVRVARRPALERRTALGLGTAA
jgi:hypothetical protein